MLSASYMPVGNAIRLVVAPPMGAASWRILRRTSDAFAGPVDPDAALVVDECADPVFADALGLTNGVEYFYRAFFSMMGGAIVASPTVSAIPAATYGGMGTDPQTFVLERIKAGLAVEVARGTLKPPTPGKPITVVAGGFAAVDIGDGPRFPIVSVHLNSDAPSHRAVGEQLVPDGQVGIGGDWMESEGWLSSVSLGISAASLNINERQGLRQALKRIVIANLGVFALAGLSQVEFSQNDSESQAEGAAVYMTNGTFTCTAPAFVEDEVEAVREVAVFGTPFTQDAH